MTLTMELDDDTTKLLEQKATEASKHSRITSNCVYCSNAPQINIEAL